MFSANSSKSHKDIENHQKNRDVIYYYHILKMKIILIIHNFSNYLPVFTPNGSQLKVKFSELYQKIAKILVQKQNFQPQIIPRFTPA